jgi:hypothetical protein
MRHDGARPGMPGDDRVPDLEPAQGLCNDRRLPGGLGPADPTPAPAPAMPWTVEGDDPVARREGGAEPQHGFDEIRHGPVQENDRPERLGVTGRPLQKMEPASLDLHEPARGRVEPLDPAGMGPGENRPEDENQRRDGQDEEDRVHPLARFRGTGRPRPGRDGSRWSERRKAAD